MQKLLTTVIVLFLYLNTLSSQVPQSICYQAVATDQSGRELVSQNVKVRISILKSSMSGLEEWVETHSVITDGFGLFDFQIGNGSRIGGTQINFKDIKWGQDKYYLKVELDVNGGNNFVLMGTNQMISVPYSLYSDKASFAAVADSAAKAGIALTALKADSAKFASLADSSRRAAFSYRAIFADSSSKSYYSTTAQTALKADSAKFALKSDTAKFAISAQKAIFADSSSKSYYSTIAQTAIKADSAKFAASADSAKIAIKALKADSSKFAFNSDSAKVAVKAVKADSSKFSTYSDTSKIAIVAQRAMLADSASKSYSSIIAQSALKSDSARFAWYADSSRRAAQAQRAVVADSSFRAGTAWHSYTSQRSFVSDSTIKSSTSTYSLKSDTALVAKTALDDLDKDPKNELQTLTFKNDTLSISNPYGPASSVVFSKEPFRAPGASIDYPLGIYGQPIAVTTDYTVPVGYNFFISAVNDGVKLSDGRTLYAEPGMPIIPSGYRISECYCTALLMEEQVDITTLILDFSNPNYIYTVPDGYSLIIKSGKTARGLLDLQIDTDIFNFYTVTSQSPRLIVINAGKKVKKPITLLPSDALVLTGYLLKNKK